MTSLSVEEKAKAGPSAFGYGMTKLIGIILS